MSALKLQWTPRPVNPCGETSWDGTAEDIFLVLMQWPWRIYIYLRNRHWKQLVELSGSDGVRSGTSVVVLKNTVHLNVLKSSKGFQM